MRTCNLVRMWKPEEKLLELVIPFHCVTVLGADLAGPVPLLLNWESDLVKMDILCYFMRSKHPIERVSKAAYHRSLSCLLAGLPICTMVW